MFSGLVVMSITNSVSANFCDIVIKTSKVFKDLEK